MINHKLLNLFNVPDWNNYLTAQYKTIQSMESIITKIILKEKVFNHWLHLAAKCDP